MRKRVFLVGLMISMLAGNALWAESIGFIDIQKVFTGYEKTQSAQDKFRDKEQALQKEIEEKQKEIEKAKEDKKSEADIRELIDRLDNELEPKRRELLEIREALTNEIQNDIIKATEAAAKDLGIDVVVDKQAVIVGGIDMTSLVIEKLSQ